MNYVDKKSVALVRDPADWGGWPLLNGVKITLTRAPRRWCWPRGVTRSTSPSAVRPGGAGLQEELEFTYYNLPDVGARQLCMRTDQGVLKDAAFGEAGTPDQRPQQMQKILLGDGQVGNEPLLEGAALTDR